MIQRRRPAVTQIPSRPARSRRFSSHNRRRRRSRRRRHGRRCRWPYPSATRMRCPAGYSAEWWWRCRESATASMRRCCGKSGGGVLSRTKPLGYISMGKCCERRPPNHRHKTALVVGKKNHAYKKMFRETPRPPPPSPSYCATGSNDS